MSLRRGIARCLRRFRDCRSELGIAALTGIGVGFGGPIDFERGEIVRNPEAIVIGGGVSGAGELMLAPLRAALAGQLMPGMPAPVVVRAELGDDAGVLGALALAVDA